MLFQGGFPPPFTLHPFFIFPHSTFYPFLSYGPLTPPSIPTFLFPPVTTPSNPSPPSPPSTFHPFLQLKDILRRFLHRRLKWEFAQFLYYLNTHLGYKILQTFLHTGQELFENV